DFTRQRTSRKNTKNYERKHEESHSRSERHHIGGLEPRADSNVRNYRRRCISPLFPNLASLIQGPREDSEAKADKSHDNGDGADQPHPPVVSERDNRSCPGKMRLPVTPFDQPPERQVHYHQKQPDHQ